jgi:hypothetical protein
MTIYKDANEYFLSRQDAPWREALKEHVTITVSIYRCPATNDVLLTRLSRIFRIKNNEAHLTGTYGHTV